MGKLKLNLVTKQINEIIEAAINVHLQNGKKFEIVLPVVINGQELAKYIYTIENGKINWKNTGNKFNETI